MRRPSIPLLFALLVVGLWPRYAAAEASPAPGGLVVVATHGATDAAWPLARSIYAIASLRPATMDEAKARALCGEEPSRDASAEVRDLAADVAQVHGDDAPSRALLGDIGRRTAARAVIVVRIHDAGPDAHGFLTETGSFDAATYVPDPGSRLSWDGATRSLARTFGTIVAAPDWVPPPGAVPAPPLATHEAPRLDEAAAKHTAFYESYWFWGALGAAAALAGVVYITHADNGPTMLHMQMNIPH